MNAAGTGTVGDMLLSEPVRDGNRVKTTRGPCAGVSSNWVCHCLMSSMRASTSTPCIAA